MNVNSGFIKCNEIIGTNRKRNATITPAMIGNAAPYYLARLFHGIVIDLPRTNYQCYVPDTDTTYATGVGKFPYCFIRTRSRNKGANLDIKLGDTFVHFELTNNETVKVTYYTRQEVENAILEIINRGIPKKFVNRKSNFVPKTAYVQELMEIKTELLKIDHSDLSGLIYDLIGAQLGVFQTMDSFLSMIEIHQNKEIYELIIKLENESNVA